MKSNYFLKQLAMLLAGIFITGMLYANAFPGLLLDLEEVELKTGETYQLPSVLKYMETPEGDTVEVAVEWTVEPDSLGSINEFAVFTAEKPGRGYLHVSYGSVLDSLELEIEKEDEPEVEKYPKLLLPFDEVELEAGETFQLPAVLGYVESFGADTLEVAVEWTAFPDTLGNLDASGTFTAEKPGEGYLYVSYESVKDSVELEVEEKDESEVKKYPKLFLTFDKVKLEAGETFQLPAVLDYIENSEADTVEVAVEWAVVPDTLGSIDEFAVFTAEHKGEGYLRVNYESVQDSVELEIEEEDENEVENYPKLLLPFDKVKLEAGETFQLPSTLDYIEYLGADTLEIAAEWAVSPDTLGSIDELAVFTAENKGEGYLRVSYDSVQDSVELEVEEADDEKEDDYPKVKIIPGNVKVKAGDILELYAFYVDSLGKKTDTTFIWSIEPAELGAFPDTEVPVLHTNSAGKGIVIATLGELADTIEIEIYNERGEREDEEKGRKDNQLVIFPGDTTLFADGGMVQFSAYFDWNVENGENNNIIWSVSDTTIATIDSDGVLTLTGTPGLILITAENNSIKASAELLVLDPDIDPEVNTITIHRVLPDGRILNPKSFKEGESYMIGGLPYPLNLLNSGMLHFPYGCISEDITIYMKIPEEYTSMNPDDTGVTFSDEIITGVEFNVQPASADTIVHPFWFNVPVELKLPFKRGLLHKLGIDPYNLDVFFAENARFVPVEDGVATVDSSANMIYASIEHFSVIVVRKLESVTSAEETSPLNKDVMKIYPNPFTASTTIQLHLKEAGNVEIDVYNIVGQKVATLTDRYFDKGNYNIRWSGNDLKDEPLKSGIYLCRLIKDGKVSHVSKLVIQH